MRKIPPSKIRYERAHPLISFRSTIEEKEQIESMAETEGKSISQIVREMLLNGYIDFENTYNEALDLGGRVGRKTGRIEGKSEWGIKIPCNICGKDDLFLFPNDECHKFIIEYLKKCGWGHVACHEKKKLS